jgi:hypothetical protein
MATGPVAPIDPVQAMDETRSTGCSAGRIPNGPSGRLTDGDAEGIALGEGGGDADGDAGSGSSDGEAVACGLAAVASGDPDAAAPEQPTRMVRQRSHDPNRLGMRSAS